MPHYFITSKMTPKKTLYTITIRCNLSKPKSESSNLLVVKGTCEEAFKYLQNIGEINKGPQNKTERPYII